MATIQLDYEQGDIRNKPGKYYWIKLQGKGEKLLAFCIAYNFYMLPQFSRPISLDENDMVAEVKNYEQEAKLD